MKIFDVSHTLRPSRYGPSKALAGEYGSDAILCVPLRTGRSAHRFALGFIGAHGHSRRVTDGPILPGPYAFACGLPTCISADPRMSTGAEMRAARANNLVIDAEIGDLLTFQGSHFRIDPDHNDNVKLTHVTVTVTEIPAPAPAEDHDSPRTVNLAHFTDDVAFDESHDLWHD